MLRNYVDNNKVVVLYFAHSGSTTTTGTTGHLLRGANPPISKESLLRLGRRQRSLPPP
jgi:hypothetical protein